MNFSVDFFITTISLLQKFNLTSTEMKDDKKIPGKKKVEYRRLTSGNNNERIENVHTNPCESDWIDVGDTEFNRRGGEIFQSVKGDEEQKRNWLKVKKLRKMLIIFHFLVLENYDKDRVFEIIQQKLSRWLTTTFVTKSIYW